MMKDVKESKLYQFPRLESPSKKRGYLKRTGKTENQQKDDNMMKNKQ